MLYFFIIDLDSKFFVVASFDPKEFLLTPHTFMSVVSSYPILLVLSRESTMGDRELHCIVGRG